MIKFIVIILAIFPCISLACSFSPSYRNSPFLVVPSNDNMPNPNPPEIEVNLIERGYDDGNFASCSDAGIIEFKVSNNKVGYDITTIEPEEHKSTIPDGIYGAVQEDNGYYIRFIWLDGSRNYQEPLFVRVKVRAISKTGGISEPVELKIEHPGGISR